MLNNETGRQKPAFTPRERVFMRQAFLALLLAASVTPALAQDKTVNLKVSLWVPPAHPLVPATQAWAADIEKASGGSIKVSVFPSEQLGKAADHYDMARDGIADITYVNPGYQGGRFPIAAAGQLPFTFSDGKKGTLALNEWYHKYAPTEMKDTKLCFAFIHDPGALHGKKKIIDDHCTPEWASKVTDPWTEFEANGRVKMKALEGHEVYPLTPEQLGEWKKAVKPLHDSWAEAVKKAGGDAAAIDSDLQATLKKFEAGI